MDDVKQWRDEAKREHDRRVAAEAFLESKGYRRCDIPACNCGSWHGGNAEDRLSEIRDVLIDAGVEMNGQTIRGGVGALSARLRAVDELVNRWANEDVYDVVGRVKFDCALEFKAALSASTTVEQP